MITKEQSRAARGLLDWSQTQLAAKAGLGESTIRSFENGPRSPHPSSLVAIKSTFDAAGVVFIEAIGGETGVRLRD